MSTHSLSIRVGTSGRRLQPPNFDFKSVVLRKSIKIKKNLASCTLSKQKYREDGCETWPLVWNRKIGIMKCVWIRLQNLKMVLTNFWNIYMCTQSLIRIAGKADSVSA